jgi:hypothetical protein
MKPDLLPAKREEGLPPVLAGRKTPAVRERVEGFYSAVAAIFETWVNRRKSENARRAYREDVQPAHLAAFELLQIPGRRRGRAAASNHRAESGSGSVHPSAYAPGAPIIRAAISRGGKR